MSPAPQRIITLHDRIEPALTAGDYEVRATQAIGGSSSLGTVPDDVRHVRVTGPRYRLPSTELLSVFPPPDSDGPFVTRLAQVALKRRTLPWERAESPARPWLALVLLTDAEGTYLPSVPVADAVTEGVTLGGDNPDGPTCAAIEVTERVVEQVFPSRRDLPYTCHVREVPLDDTELAQGDDDGWVAVVLGCRLPRPQMRYRACLISLEGQWDALPENPPVEDRITKVSVYDDLSVETIALARKPRTDGVPISAGGAAAFNVAGLAPKAAGAAIDREAAPHALPPASLAHSPADAYTGASYVGAGAASTGSQAAFDMGSIALDVDLRVIDPLSPRLRFPVLASWEFRCEGDKDFAALVQALDVGLLGTDAAPRAAAARPIEVSDTGHVVLDGTERSGEAERSWYRGPLTPRAVTRRPPAAVHVADQLRRLAEDGRFEIGEAAAFELGRLLAISAPSTVAALREWRRQGFSRRRRGNVGAGSALGDIFAAWDITLAERSGPLLGLLVLETLGNPDVVDLILPGQGLVDPLPELSAVRRPRPHGRRRAQPPGGRRGRELRGDRAPGDHRGAPRARHDRRLRRAARRSDPAGRAERRPDHDHREHRRAGRPGGPMKHSVDAPTVLQAAMDAATGAADDADTLPPELIDLLVRLRVLEGVPFEYIVPDEQLLPAESIRFFYLDRNWTDALVQGALSVGAVTTRDRIDVAARWPAVRADLDEAEHDARARLAGRGSVRGAAETVTGFLVRSRAISGWPGVQVRAYRRTRPERPDDTLSGLEEMRLLRLERLAPAVLLALIDGVPDQVHLEEPRAGIQFGVDEAAGGRYTAALKHPVTGERVQSGGDDVTATVPFRRGAPGVVAVSRLAQALLDADTGDLLGSSLGSAEYALQMLQLPYRQVFGEEDTPPPGINTLLRVPSETTIATITELWERT